LNLTECKPGDKVKVIYLSAGISVRSKLSKMNIKEDSILEVIAHQPWNGPITVKVGNSKQTIGRGLSMKIICEPVNGIEDTPKSST